MNGCMLSTPIADNATILALIREKPSTAGTNPPEAGWCAKPAKGLLFRPSQQRA